MTLELQITNEQLNHLGELSNHWDTSYRPVITDINLKRGSIKLEVGFMHRDDAKAVREIISRLSKPKVPTLRTVIVTQWDSNGGYFSYFESDPTSLARGTTPEDSIKGLLGLAVEH